MAESNYWSWKKSAGNEWIIAQSGKTERGLKPDQKPLSRTFFVKDFIFLAMLYRSIYTDVTWQYWISPRLKRDQNAVVREQLQISCQSHLKYPSMIYLKMISSPRDEKQSLKIFFTSTAETPKKTCNLSTSIRKNEKFIVQEIDMNLLTHCPVF